MLPTAVGQDAEPAFGLLVGGGEHRTGSGFSSLHAVRVSIRPAQDCLHRELHHAVKLNVVVCVRRPSPKCEP